MHRFKDTTGNEIILTFEEHSFKKEITDVLLFPLYGGQIVMTKHPRRGMELPGGKVEEGETAIAAAIREMWEETGGVLSGLRMIGQYFFMLYDKPIVKAIYLADVSHFETFPTGYETNGYALVPYDINVQSSEFSPYVQDDVFPYILKYLRCVRSAF